MTSPTPGLSSERRGEERLATGGFPLLSPADAKIVDCGRRGAGIETNAHLAVGSLTTISVFVPQGEVELLGRVCWARMVAARAVGGGDYEPVFRAGLSFIDEQSLGAWDRLRAVLVPQPRRRRKASRPRRRVIKWRRPQLGSQRPE